MSDRPMCRLFVIPARDERLAVIVRRGPRQWCQLILWETRRDVFTPGAWIRGRIYPERCDLSPDGALFVYFVFKANRHGTRFTDSWTAVSRPPWLYALALWPWGCTYGGGGRFVAKRKLILHAGMLPPHHPDFPPRNLEVEPGQASYHESAGLVAGAEWSGHDQRGYVIFTRDWRLFRLMPRRRTQEVELADFNGLAPHPQPAPDWAKRPL